MSEKGYKSGFSYKVKFSVSPKEVLASFEILATPPVFDGVGSSVVVFYAIECFHSHDGYRIKYWFHFKDTGIGTGVIILLNNTQHYFLLYQRTKSKTHTKNIKHQL